MADGCDLADVVNHWPEAIPIHPRGRAVIGFAGGGGSSVAYKMATGRDPDACFNHWITACLAHQRHFPLTEHHCADAFDVDPVTTLPGEAIDFGWFSPDCTDFSKAKGKAPRSERIRGLAWSVIPWAKLRRIRVIMLENVEEFAQWGPVYRSGLKAGEPIPARRGETFRRWKGRLETLGYTVEWRILNAADYGAPTTRKRLYLVARCDGQPVVWPARTHAPRKDAERLGLKPWVGANTIIDWSIDCPSIFFDQAEVAAYYAATGKRVKRPLVAATDRRIAKGMVRHVMEAAEPCLVNITQRNWAADRAHGVREPAPTLLSSKGGEYALVSPALASVAHGPEARTWPITDPARTQTGQHDKALVAAALHQMNTRDVGADATEPARTHTATEHQALTAATLVPRYGERQGQAPRTIDAKGPLPTVVPDGNGASLAAAHLVRQFGSAVGEKDLAEPVGTTMGQGARGGGKDQLVTAFMAQGNQGMPGKPPEEPFTTQTGRGTQQQLVAASLDTYYGGGSVGSNPDNPMRTATHKARFSLIAAWLEQANTDMVGHELPAPVSTIVGKGSTQRSGPTRRGRRSRGGSSAWC